MPNRRTGHAEEMAVHGASFELLLSMYLASVADGAVTPSFWRTAAFARSPRLAIRGALSDTKRAS